MTRPVPPTVKGTCPSLMEPMGSGDGLLVRVKPRCAALSAENARLIAAQSLRYGNGIIDLTNRGNLQVRGLKPGTVAEFAAPLVEAGLANPDAAMEAIRNVQVDPLGLEDSRARIDSHALARKLEVALLTHPDANRLPAKFGVSIDGRADTLASPASLRISALTADEVTVQLGRTDVSLTIAFRDDLPLRQLLQNVIRLFVKYIDVNGSKRFDCWIEDGGIEDLDGAGYTCTAAPRVASRPANTSALGLFQAKSSVGVSIGAAYGQLQARQLTSLCDLADSLGDGQIRITGDKGLVLLGFTYTDAAEGLRQADGLGFITTDADPRRRIITCPGNRGCRSSWIDTHKMSEYLTKISQKLPERLHLTGCTKGCAYPAPADLTLVGGPEGLGVIRHGKADDEPEIWIAHPLELEACL